MMIQVPHDGVTGVSPWIAGGGATLRGVPETNSIAPFVLSTDRNGKIIQHNNAPRMFSWPTGRSALLAEDVSDDVFKAMCTVSGPAPQNFRLNSDPKTPLIPPPENKEAVKPAVKAPVKTEPVKQEKTNGVKPTGTPTKTEPAKKSAETKTDPKSAAAACCGSQGETAAKDLPTESAC